jgi:hypothetical protein
VAVPLWQLQVQICRLVIYQLLLLLLLLLLH